MLHHYILTRFSILDCKSTNFVISRSNTCKNLKNKLFNNDRLDFKFKVFDKITYPSIKNQTYTNYTWLIYASKYIPDKYKDKLNTYADDKIKIIYIKDFNEMNKDLDDKLDKKENYTTLRLDDDDGLNLKFLEILNTYKDKKGSIISFPYGRKFKLNNTIIYNNKSYYQKNIGLGLTAIGFNIFTAGNHNKVNENYTVYYNNLKDAYDLCSSKFCDTKRKFTIKNKH